MGNSSRILLTLCVGTPLLAQASSPIDPGRDLPVEPANSVAILEGHQGHQDAVPDLGFLSFFTAGWDQPWEHRHDRYTPDMALLRVTTNALEKELRLDYTDTDARGNPKVDTSQVGSALIAFAINRRLMVEVINNAQWNEDFHSTTTSGSGGGGGVD